MVGEDEGRLGWVGMGWQVRMGEMGVGGWGEDGGGGGGGWGGG